MDWTGTYVQIASVTLNTEHTPKPIMEANAAFIVRAVNSFEPLLEAARKVEARSHYDADENAYHVDAEAMDKLCEIIGKAKR